MCSFNSFNCLVAREESWECQNMTCSITTASVITRAQESGSPALVTVLLRCCSVYAAKYSILETKWNILSQWQYDNVSVFSVPTIYNINTLGIHTLIIACNQERLAYILFKWSTMDTHLTIINQWILNKIHSFIHLDQVLDPGQCCSKIRAYPGRKMGIHSWWDTSPPQGTLYTNIHT